MSKKIKISLNSTLIDTIVSKTKSIQEQYDSYIMTQDGAKEVSKMFQNVKEKEKECKACNKKALRLARKIVALDFEGWTEGDTKFYYKNEKKLCCSAVNGGMPTLIKHVEDGEPGWCDNWLHCVLPIIEIGLLFVPGIGWAVALGLSMTVGLIDAAIYYSEGEEETAGLVAFLTILPGVPGVVKKFPFVKSWAKQGTKKISEKLITGEGLSMLERYQLKSLSTESAQKFLELEVKQHIRDLASKEFFGEAVEIGGKKITKEMIDNAVEKGYLEMTIGGTKSKLSKELVTALTKSKKFTAIQQLKLIKFIKQVTPFLLAGMGYFKIMDEVAKSGARGPKKLIEKLWGYDLDDTSERKINNFFQKVADPESEINNDIKTKWDFIKFIFNSSGSAKDGELMVQAVKSGWNPFEEGKGVVPKKYRTNGYKVWVKNIITNEKLLKWFNSDGSETDTRLLLGLLFENPGFTIGSRIPKEYQTETYKKNLEKRLADEKKNTNKVEPENINFDDLLGP